MNDRGPSPPPASPPALPWRLRLLIYVLSHVNSAALRPDGTVNRRLSSFFDSPVRSNPNPVRGVRTADVAADPGRNLWFRLFLPDASNADGGRLPVFVFFHGGGFVLFSPSSRLYDDTCRWFCREVPAAVVSVGYRLSPEHRCPDAYDDGVHVLRFLASRPADGDGVPPLFREFTRAVDLSSCFLVGDSAGGNIAHHVARRWTAGEASPVGGRLSLAGLVSLQPFFGGEERLDSDIRHASVPMLGIKWTDWMWKAFLPDGASRDHHAANPDGATAGLGEAFPPALVVTGGFDPLLDWQRRYYEGLRREGKEVKLAEFPSSAHGFFMFRELEDAQALMRCLKGFVREQLQRQQQRREQDGHADT